MNCHMTHCGPKYIPIYRGDDTDFRGNRKILIKIETDIDLEGFTAHFKCQSFEKNFGPIPETKELELVFTAEDTSSFRLGFWDAELYLKDDEGKRRTLSNRIGIHVTNSVAEAYCLDDDRKVCVKINRPISYAELRDKPTLNGVVIEGDKTSDDYHIEVGSSVVESEKNPGYAANADRAESVPWSGITGLPGDVIVNGTNFITDEFSLWHTQSEGDAPVLYFDEARDAWRFNGFVDWSYVWGKPTTVSGYGITDAATKSDLAVALDLVDVAGGYEIRLDGVRQTFDQVKTLAETRNTVVRHDQETYRPTYVGSDAMMWDCTGTVQGEVKTGQIHMSRSGNVVQLVPAKTLALKSDIPPAPSNAKITIVQGGVEKGSFTLNQAKDGSVEIDAGGGGDEKHLVNVYAFGVKGDDGSNDQFVEVGGHVIRAHQAEWSVKVDDIPIISWDIDCMALVGAFRADSVEVSYDGYQGEGAGFMAVKANGELLEEGVTQITEDTVLTIFFDFCLLSGTLILMADGSTKRIEDVHAGDVVASFNPVTGRLESDIVAASDAYCHKVVQSYDRWTFADGTVVETANRHRFWNVDLGEFMYLEAWKIGERALMHDGRTTALVSHEVVEEEATHHTLYTRKWNNYIANGLVSGNRKSKCLVRSES